MMEILRQLEVRLFSYEEDPEYLVDLHRSLEVLEGSWFDTEETCRMHYKMVARAKGSSWVGAVGRTIIGYADLLKNSPENGFVYRWRIHPDFLYPQIFKKMIQGLAEQSRKRQYKNLIFFSDTPQITDDLIKAGLKRDRIYKWVVLREVDFPKDPRIIISEIKLDRQIVDSNDYVAFLGTPLPPNFVLSRAFMAYEYGVFTFRKPEFYDLTFCGVNYLACYDGREWFVFRRGKNQIDGDAIGPILSALKEVGDGRILLSEKALEKTGLVPISDEIQCDFFLEI